MKKNYSVRVKPRRYVFHVTRSVHRQSILKNGLLGRPDESNEYRNAVFAHNSAIPDRNWYPFCFDACMFWDYSVDFNDPTDSFAYQMKRNGYDFWRIDTWKFKKDWFLDNIGMKDFYEGSTFPFLIVTFDNIPPSVLLRYEFHDEPKVKRLNGVVHYEGRFRAA